MKRNSTTTEPAAPLGRTLAGAGSTVRPLQFALSVIGFALATALAAHVKIPIPGTTVPLTLQTLVVLLAGGMAGSAAGAGSQALYLLLGGLGLPVFTGVAGGMGWAYFTGHTAGYLFAYPLAAAWVGWGLRRPGVPGWGRLVGVLAAGTALIYLCGVSWLAVTLKVGPGTALWMGMIPFLPGAVLKLGAAAASIRALRQRFSP